MEVREFAVWAHGGQRYGEHPYVYHLDQVVEIVRVAARGDELVHDVAYLHDTIEDTPVTFDFLRELFGTEVATAVQYITDPKEGNRKERKRVVHERLGRLNPSLADHRAALVVKAADRLANLMQCSVTGNDSLMKMYVREHDDFRTAVRRADLCPALWDRMDTLVGG